MQGSVKKDWDYKKLHTSGIKVVKPVRMSDIVRLKQQNLDCIDDLDEFIDDHNVQEFDHIHKACRIGPLVSYKMPVLFSIGLRVRVPLLP